MIRHRVALPVVRAIVILGALVLAAAGAPAQSTPRSAELRAAYVLRFIDYVGWPADAQPPSAPVVVGVVGDDAMLEVLAASAASERREGLRNLEVLRCAEGARLPASLQVLFIGRGQPVAAWVRRVQGRPVLTISDDAHGLEAGSMLNLLPSEGGRPRFEASLLALQAAGVKFSARVLTLAERVLGAP